MSTADSCAKPGGGSTAALFAATFAAAAGLAAIAIVTKGRRPRQEEKYDTSERVRALTTGGTPEYIVEHIARLNDESYTCLAIAENRITNGPVIAKVRQLRAGADSSSSLAIDSSETSTQQAIDDRIAAEMAYKEPRGQPWIREALAKTMSEELFHFKVDPDRLCVASGLTTALRLLLTAIMDEGQGCLVPAPYFAGFDYTLTASGIKIIPVHSSDNTLDRVASDKQSDTSGSTGQHNAGFFGAHDEGLDDGVSDKALDASMRRARAAGVKVRALLLTSPHNPSGRMYSRDALFEAVAWARREGIHIIVDEVYANCVLSTTSKFHSIGSILGADSTFGRDVHVLYGFSKDMGVAGWRIGILYSQNEAVLGAVASLCHTSEASTDTLSLLGHILRSDGFASQYFREHQEGLRKAYESMAHALDSEGIKHLRADAGVYGMLDLRDYLDEETKEAEMRLWRGIVDATGVNLTPGTSFHCTEPGWFRLVFSYQTAEVVANSVAKVAAFLRSYKEQ